MEAVKSKKEEFESMIENLLESGDKVLIHAAKGMVTERDEEANGEYAWDEKTYAVWCKSLREIIIAWHVAEMAFKKVGAVPEVITNTNSGVSVEVTPNQAKLYYYIIATYKAYEIAEKNNDAALVKNYVGMFNSARLYFRMKWTHVYNLLID